MNLSVITTVLTIPYVSPLIIGLLFSPKPLRVSKKYSYSDNPRPTVAHNSRKVGEASCLRTLRLHATHGERERQIQF